MSSSFIEVSGRDEVGVMVVNEKDDDETIEFHSLNAAEVIPFSEMETSDQEMLQESQDYDDLGIPPGTIIFSPQDTLAPRITRSGGRMRGRGRGRGSSSKRSVALTLKMEDGIDYTKVNLPVACQVCGKIMANGKILLQHMATHLETKAYQCPSCPKSFTRMVHLQGHLVFHGIQKQFECPVCHQRFSRQDCVRVHMRLHDKSKCVFCTVCHKAFLTLGALNIHMRIHRGEKPFKCHLCGKCFTQKNHVITHIKRHTKVSDAPFSKKLGPRMFQCEHCPRSFIRLSDYERHVQWNHGAIADADKPPINDAAFIGESDDSVNFMDDFVTPVETLNNKVRKRTFFRKVVCTVGTQTDEGGGHIIIPRQYKSTASMTSSGTQMSAPATPRGADDELYENDMFDEGMDRNFSSDEEELEERIVKEPEIVSYQSFKESSTAIAKDDAFDEVLGKVKEKTLHAIKKDIVEPPVSDIKESSDDNIEETSVPDAHEAKESHSNQNAEISEPQQEKAIKEPITTSENIVQKSELAEVTLTIKKPEIVKPKVTKVEHKKLIKPFFVKRAPSPLQEIEQSMVEPMIRLPPKERDSDGASSKNVKQRAKIFDTFNTKNWKGHRRARGRARGTSRKGIIGLTGATHLRLIRKSMMNFISEKTEGYNEMIKAKKQCDPEYIVPDNVEKKHKRQSKLKQHGKDFICSVKTCEACHPKVSSEEADAEADGEVEEEDPAVEALPETKGPPKDQSQKLLQFLLSGDIANLQGTDFRLLSDINVDDQCEVLGGEGHLTASQLSSEMNSSDMLHSDGLFEKSTSYFSANPNDSTMSPPVELRSFCIPTYSCKLCGREFRFEGKLHRHIESVHQRKTIFSPDVKPGRGSGKYSLIENAYIFATGEEDDDELMAPPSSSRDVKNPEIEALRSEWDDDDAEGGHEGERKPPKISMTTPTLAKKLTPYATTPIYRKAPVVIKPIVTKEIVPTTTTLSDTYIHGVKLNINKLSGLADFEENSNKKKITADGASVPQSLTKPSEKVISSLDTKCGFLLEKLFDHDLLMECGLYDEHVSVVLGRVLQHYGVKMIEDYGQGQYEVLKYNLWRLIEWKVTMEQMEEFYTEGKSVEEMMDDIMNGIVPVIAHHEVVKDDASKPMHPDQEEQIAMTAETVEVSESQLVLSRVANVLGSQISLADGVTQVVLAQDVSPELLQGAHIVTIDPATGQVLSQVTADRVILADSVTAEIEQQIQSINEQVASQNSSMSESLMLNPQQAKISLSNSQIHLSKRMDSS